MSHESIRIGVDLGGTKIEAAALDPDGAICARRRVATPRDDYAAIIRSIGALVHELELELDQRGTVGLCGPGSLSKHTGLIRGSNTAVVNGKALPKDLSKILQRPVKVENDANCFALSEAIDGAGKGGNSIFGVILGTGVGGGMVIDGKIVSGCNHIAGEWGHTPLPWMSETEYPGKKCFCGHRGCIETFLCGEALSDDFKSRTGEKKTTKEIVILSRQGDDSALHTLATYQDRLARALALLINIYDPDIIVLGGGLSNINEIYFGLIDKVAAHAFTTDRLETRILQNQHGDSSGVRGAAWLGASSEPYGT